MLARNNFGGCADTLQCGARTDHLDLLETIGDQNCNVGVIQGCVIDELRHAVSPVEKTALIFSSQMTGIYIKRVRRMEKVRLAPIFCK
jgi:hypothetical protein